MDAETAPALPRRVSSRAQPQGRHRSPDRLSVPRAAPVLVLAVPAPECAASAEIAAGVAAVAGTLCPGAAIRTGYVGDGAASLAAVTAERTATGAGPAEGAGPALGQLVTMRYGAALLDPAHTARLGDQGA